MGGEKNIVRKASFDPEGSPPRGRGKEIEFGFSQVFSGITPAWAGKSQLHSGCRKDGEDHPRVGGEKLVSFRHIHIILGSPPRGRGKVVSHVPCLVYHGITPAWAGKRHSMQQRKTSAKDHPRVGGEKSLLLYSLRVSWGSPPRGRGKD